jgi:hypothetical protein
MCVTPYSNAAQERAPRDSRVGYFWAGNGLNVRAGLSVNGENSNRPARSAVGPTLNENQCHRECAKPHMPRANSVPNSHCKNWHNAHLRDASGSGGGWVFRPANDCNESLNSDAELIS